MFQAADTRNALKYAWDRQLAVLMIMSNYNKRSGVYFYMAAFLYIGNTILHGFNEQGEHHFCRCGRRKTQFTCCLTPIQVPYPAQECRSTPLVRRDPRFQANTLVFCIDLRNQTLISEIQAFKPYRSFRYCG